ncbi:MAG: ATP-binding cassette domain-containing protein, partial [Deltaproteobacteria bacterium]|nr:ATP-binding cassette domain-containing protein [Deltaproteobacteria bacterium]
SHGQKQRVAIARALITNPDLLFADEPVSALDPFIRSKILGLFRQKMEQGMAIVLISHDLEIFERIKGSRALTGSSANKRSGFVINALAMATLCF